MSEGRAIRMDFRNESDHAWEGFEPSVFLPVVVEALNSDPYTRQAERSPVRPDLSLLGRANHLSTLCPATWSRNPLCLIKNLEIIHKSLKGSAVDSDLESSK